MTIVKIDCAADPRVADYHNVRDADLVRRAGLFVAEGRLVVERLLAAPRFVLRSVLLNDATLRALGPLFTREAPGVPLYVCSSSCAEEIAGYQVHRGCLALAERPIAADPVVLTRDASTIVLLDRVANPDNIGGIFRNARAFGADAVLLSSGCADPLYRKAIRTSMAAALDVPFAHFVSLGAQMEILRREGFAMFALTPAGNATTFRDRLEPGRPARAAIVLGEEAEGLGADAFEHSDEAVRIPMAPGADSLNVAVAAGVALYELRFARPISARS